MNGEAEPFTVYLDVQKPKPRFPMLGDLLSSALTFGGARMANEATKKLAREQMAFQQESNREQMAFQERMSNTSYQRAMQDMQSAGLNPILAFNQGGASAMSGASSGGASATMANELAPAVSSALDSKRLRYEVENMKAQNDNLKAQNDLFTAQHAQSLSQAYLNQEQMKSAMENQKLIQANTAKSVASTDQIKSDTLRKWVDSVGDQVNPLKFLNKFIKTKRK